MMFISLELKDYPGRALWKMCLTFSQVYIMCILKYSFVWVKGNFTKSKSSYSGELNRIEQNENCLILLHGHTMTSQVPFVLYMRFKDFYIQQK
jgi:predicted phosphodiesterase